MEAAPAPLVQGAAYVCGIWALVVLAVQTIGNFSIFTRYASRPRKPVSPTLAKEDIPHVTVIRPVKGLEPNLHECIASSFQQTYPKDKLTIYLCVSEKSDPAYPVLANIIKSYPGFDAHILVEQEDPLLHGSEGHAQNLGPNPKIRNISRAYREAKGDVIWVIDCNVWISKGVAGRMVDRLYGFEPHGQRVKPFLFAHMLPLVVDTSSLWNSETSHSPTTPATASPSQRQNAGLLANIARNGGGRLDEMFMATTHAKFYSAINTVGVAPCAVGKSNMFRKSHIETLTDPALNPSHVARPADPRGLDYFSNYICEDHLISDLLWKAHTPGFRKHGIVFGDMAVQPLGGFSVRAYIGRRVRWLRARKWTVLLATIVEPGIESLLCCAHLSFAVTTIPWFGRTLGVPRTWEAMGVTWLLALTAWMFGDWCTYSQMHAGQSVEVDEDTPSFARGTSNPGGTARRPFWEWLPAWLGREVLALPIWTWAVLLGSTVSWRGQTFRVRMDMSVVKLDDEKPAKTR